MLQIEKKAKFSREGLKWGIKGMASERLRYLDFLRGIAVILVMAGHFIDVATWGTEIPGVIHPNNIGMLPITPTDTQNYWRASVFLVDSGGVQNAIVGVVFFFVLTGCFIPDSLNHYGRKKFLLNRFFRIFPTLWVCMIIDGIVVFILQGIQFSINTWLFTMSGLWKVFNVVPVSGVLWTLDIELFFYFCCTVIGKFNLRRVYIMYFGIIVGILVLPTDNYWICLVAGNFKWMSLIFVGVCFNLVQKNISEKQNVKKIFGGGYIPVLLSIMLSFISFNIFKYRFGDETTYPKLATFVFCFSVFFLLVYLNNVNPVIFNKKFNAPIHWLAAHGFTIYLLHVSVGMPLMFWLRGKGGSSYLAIILGIMSSLILAQIVAWIVEKPSIALVKSLMSRYKMNVTQ